MRILLIVVHMSGMKIIGQIVQVAWRLCHAARVSIPLVENVRIFLAILQLNRLARGGVSFQQSDPFACNEIARSKLVILSRGGKLRD